MFSCCKKSTENGTNSSSEILSNAGITYDTNLPNSAPMPVSKNSPYYKMTHPKRGKALIFNFDRWDNTSIPNLGLQPRLGSEKDKQDLTRTLEKLDFEVEPHDNCENLEFWSILEKLKNADHSQSDCLLITIMTHGERNTIFVKDGTQIPVNLIWEYFEAHKCPTLAGKPKIFIIQACRGKKYDSGTELTSTNPLTSINMYQDVTDTNGFSYLIPNAADMIVAFSCPIGHFCWRNPQQGSWFIQSICNVFEMYMFEMDLQQLFTTVAREVAVNYESRTDEDVSNKKKQVTSTSSTLIRIVKFEKKLEQGLENFNLGQDAQNGNNIIDIRTGQRDPITLINGNSRNYQTNGILPNSTSNITATAAEIERTD